MANLNVLDKDLTARALAATPDGDASYIAIRTSEHRKPSYRYGSIGNTPAATPTDILTIAGSGTKTIRIKSVKLSGVATANGNMPVALIRRTSLDTTGTKTNPTPVALDNVNDGAATATLSLYTVNPGGLGSVLGTNGIIGVARLFLATTATGTPQVTSFDFCVNQDKPVILRGSTDNLAINLQGAAVPAGGLIDIFIEWEEDAS